MNKLPLIYHAADTVALIGLTSLIHAPIKNQTAWTAKA
jgi:hypothetical protein